MNFRIWIESQTDNLLEFGDITKASTSNIKLEPDIDEENENEIYDSIFNKYQAEAECEEELKKQDVDEDDAAIWVHDCVADKYEAWKKSIINKGFYPRKYDFSHGGEDFKVQFVPAEDYVIDLNQERIDNIYYVVFEGPNGHFTTGKMSGTHHIYTQLMLAVKKLLEETKVNGLKFSAYTSDMRLVYHKFYKRYLSKEFIQVNSETYIRKDVLKEKAKGINPAEKGYFYQDILNSYRNKLGDLKDIKKDKEEFRKSKIQAIASIGKISGVSDGWSTVKPGIILKVFDGYSSRGVSYQALMLGFNSLKIGNGSGIWDLNTVDVAIIHKFVQLVSSSEYMNNPIVKKAITEFSPTVSSSSLSA